MIKSTFEVIYFFHFCFILSTSNYYYTDTLQLLHSYYTSSRTKLIHTVTYLIQYNGFFVGGASEVTKSEVGKFPIKLGRDAFSWKGRLERTKTWLVSSCKFVMNLERIEFGSATKVGVLENYQFNWKDLEVGKSEVGKDRAKLERAD